MPDMLTRVAGWNRTAVFLITLVIGLVALFLPGAYGGVPLLVIAVALVVLLARTWPMLPQSQRILRPAVLLMLVVIAVGKFVA